MTDGAVVVGTNYRALAVAQSLGRHGVPVVVLDKPGSSVPLASYSRYVKKVITLPNDGESSQVGFLVELADRAGLQGWTLIPTTDDSAALSSRNAGRLATVFRLTVPGWDILRWACDKRLAHQLAAEQGIPSPRTWEVGGDSVGPLASEYPVIIKPAVKSGINALTIAKAWRVDDEPTLRRKYAEAVALMDPSALLVQELIPGGGEDQLSFAALTNGGRPIASLVARRTRQFPMDFGRASTFVETIHDSEVAEFGTRLLAAMEYTGLIEIEFKRDSRTRVLKLLDLNPRVWGWHSLGRRAGTDFSWLLWRLVHGDTPQPMEGRVGVRWMWLGADIPTATRELLKRRLRWQDYLRQFRRPIDFAPVTLDDPLPGLVELPLHAASALSRRLPLSAGRAASNGVPAT